MKDLVTGGAGFIGSNLVRQLVADGHDVTVLDSLLSGFRSNLDSFPQVRFIEGDIRDEKVAPGFRLEPLVVYQDPRPRDVLHCSAEVLVARSLLEFVPSVSMEEGFKVYMSWATADAVNTELSKC